MKLLRIIIFLSIAMVSSSCSSASRIPIESIQLHALEPDQLSLIIARLSGYAKDHDLEVTEKKLMKDGVEVTLLDIHYQDCLIISADNFEHQDSLELFLYKCNGFDWGKERDSLGNALNIPRF